jgi:stearoyl-CoA desaturase (delta-9 desaturase)
MASSRLSSRAPKFDGTLISFVGVHLAALGVFFTGMGWREAAICAGLYFIRMFAITGGYHRLFAHRAYHTSRAFQFVMAFVAQTSLQSGAVWWAAKHRDHHRYSDTPRDVHSPRQYGFWFAHMGWIFHAQGGKADYARVPDLTRCPELMWLDRQRFAPGILLAFACWALDGWPGLFGGFLVSTVVLYHGTFMINSLAHVSGTQRYLTGDDARNNWWLALITLGEGWHNNHHYFMASSRQGFYWWEVDVTYYLLRGLAALGLVWDLKEPPAHVRAGQRSLSEEIKERVAETLAGTFVMSLPQLPSLDEMRRRAQKMFARSPAMDEIITRAREMLELYLSGQLALQPVRVRA